MSVKVSSLCWKVRLSATEKLVLLRLADFADDQGFNIYPAVQTISDDCGVGRRAAQLTLKKLVDVGILVVINQGGGRRRTTEYAIDLDHLKQLRDAPPDENRYANGHAANHANSANSASRAPFVGENSASDDINSEPRSPNPLLPVKEEGGGGTGAPAHEIAVVVGGLAGLKATESNIATVEAWLTAGYHPQLDIYPAVVGALPTAKTVPGTFAYFTNAVGRHHTARINPPQESSNVLPIRSSAKQHRGHSGRATGRTAQERMVARELEGCDFDPDGPRLREG